LAIPATLGLILLRTPLVALLYQRGEFTEHSTKLVAWALLWYAAGLVGHSLVEVLARAFYAMRDTKTPVLVGVVAMSLNVAFSVAFSALSSGWLGATRRAGAGQLAGHRSRNGCLLLIMRRRLDGLQGRSLLLAAGRGVSSSLNELESMGWLAMQRRPAGLAGALGGLAIGQLFMRPSSWQWESRKVAGSWQRCGGDYKIQRLVLSGEHYLLQLEEIPNGERALILFAYVQRWAFTQRGENTARRFFALVIRKGQPGGTAHH